jgi:HK97 family phage portal protein
MGEMGEKIKASTDNIYNRFIKWFKPYNIFTRQNTHALATNETIFAAVSRLSNSMGAMPIKLKDSSYREVTNHWAAELIVHEPNLNMTSFDFMRTMETIRNITGNAYAIKDYDDYFVPKALWILDPGKVTEVIEKDTRELWYEIQGDNGRYYAHNTEVIHVKHIHGFGYRGISPIDVLRNTVNFDAKVKEFSLEQINSAITASFILELAAHMDEEKKKEVLESFKRFYQENGGVLIQEQGSKITELEKQNFIDTKLFEVERITRTRVAAVFNMPPHMLGEVEDVNYASMEQMNLEYVQNTLVPICTQYEKEFNRKLLLPEDRRRGLYFKCNVNSLLRGDMKNRGEFYFKGVRTGYFKPNEVRAWEDLPPEPGGDKLYMSGDLYPIDEPREKGKKN